MFEHSINDRVYTPISQAVAVCVGQPGKERGLKSTGGEFNSVVGKLPGRTEKATVYGLKCLAEDPVRVLYNSHLTLTISH